MPYLRVLLLLILLSPATVNAAVKHAAPAATPGTGTGPAPSLASGEMMRGNFAEEHWIKGLSKPVRSEGHFLVAPGHGVIWAIEKPLPIAFIVTGAGMLQTINGMPMLKQKAVNNPFLGHVSTMLAAALGGDWKKLEPNLIIARTGNAKGWRVQMTPRPTAPVRMPFRELTITGAHYAEKASVLRHDGLTDTYTFRNHDVSKGPLTEKEQRSFTLVAE